MAKDKKSKKIKSKVNVINSDDPFDCPLGHKKSMKYVTREIGNRQAMMLFSMSRRFGRNVKIATCSECGLMLNFLVDDLTIK